MAYSPAANLTSTPGLQHLATVFYQKKGLDRLYQMLRFQAASEPQDLPQGVGKTVQMWRGGLPAANTVAATEGTVGTGITLATSTVSATVSEYADFTSTSALLEETAINNMITEAAEQMSFRAALSVDNITRAEFDASFTPVATIGANLAVADLRKQVYLLQAKNVLPKFNGSNEPGAGEFLAIVSPYVAYDMVADVTAGGFIDITKYGDPSRNFSGEIGKVAGCRIVTTTNVGDDGVAAPNKKYFCYIIGKGAVGAISLAGRAPSGVVDPSKSQFALKINKSNPGSDPAGMIGTFVAYRFVYAAKCLDATVPRCTIVKADSSLI